jgi:anti-sigma factor RsiW
MTHLDVELIQRFLKARVTPEERAAVLKHVGYCAACRAALEDERRFGKLLQLADLPALPPPAATRVLERVQKAHAKRRWGQFVLQAGLIAGGAAAGYFVGALLRPAAPARPVQDANAPPGVVRSLLPYLQSLEEVRDAGSLARELPLARTFGQLLSQRTPPRT